MADYGHAHGDYSANVNKPGYPMTAPDSAGLPGSGFLDFIESHRLMPEEHKYTEVLRHAREIEAMRARENAEWLAENRTLTAELAEARAKLARVEALHKPLSGMAWDYCEDCEDELHAPDCPHIHGTPALTYEQGIRDVLRIRCVKHHDVPQYNRNEIHGGECAACAVEEAAPEGGE